MTPDEVIEKVLRPIINASMATSDVGDTETTVNIPIGNKKKISISISIERDYGAGCE